MGFFDHETHSRGEQLMGRRLRIGEINELRALGIQFQSRTTAIRQAARREAADRSIALKSDGARYTDIALALGITGNKLASLRSKHAPKNVPERPTPFPTAPLIRITFEGPITDRFETSSLLETSNSIESLVSTTSAAFSNIVTQTQ
jgi:hypothetical protein